MTPPKNAALLEIGVEELPARFIDPALDQLKSLAPKLLSEVGLESSKISVWGSPRRLAILIEGLPPKAKDRLDIAIGPPPKAAKDPQGQWTQAATGFAKAQKVPVSKLELQNTAKGERYVAVHSVKGIQSPQALKTVFPILIQKLNFPKTLVWEPSLFKFARPIRWIVALYNTKVVRFRLAGVQSDKNSYGLLSLGGKKIPISNPKRYKDILRGRCILVDPADRQSKIENQIEALIKKIKSAKAVMTPDHLREVVHLTEYPVSIRAQFEDDYLKLPPEVLITVLRKHQKFFPVQTPNGKLTANFIGVRNGPSDHQDGVRDGYERVTKARLADAQFFFEQDQKTPLADLVPKLKGVGFIEGLGNLFDKTERVQKLSQILAEKLNLDSKTQDHIKTTATLAKADLLTQMVGELPELQGIAGRIYTALTGELEIGQAIEEHYWPLTADGTLPKSTAGTIVSVADKLDNLACNFAADQIPTGSQDPFGLRRASVGLLRIISEKNWDISLNDLLSIPFSLLPSYENKSAPDQLAQFLHQRCLGWLTNQGYRADEVEAVLSATSQSFPVAINKLEGLKAVRGRPEFETLSAAIKRARNILKQAAQKKILPQNGAGSTTDSLGETEKNLITALDSAQPQIKTALDQKKYENAFLALAPLKGPVDAFFDGVMVMVDDEKVRSQRLALLQKVETLFDSVADFSKLQTQ